MKMNILLHKKEKVNHRPQSGTFGFASTTCRHLVKPIEPFFSTLGQTNGQNKVNLMIE